MAKLKRSNWAMIFAVWLVFGGLYSLQSYHYLVTIGRPAEWLPVLRNDVSYFILWSLMAVPIIRWVLAWPVSRSTWGVRLPSYMLAGFVIAFIQRGIFDILFLLMQGGNFEGFTLERWYRSVIGSFELGVFIFLTIVFVMHAWLYYQHLQDEKLHAAELQSLLSHTQLQILQRQLQPHFLFNTLNTVSGLIDTQPQIAKRIIGRIGELLRLTLEADQAPEISLKRELELCEIYLDIQRTRFGDRLEVVQKVDPQAMDAKVPTMLLQPLIENAVEHGVARITGKHVIGITVSQERSQLNLRIENEFAAVPPENNGHGFGIGLSNTQARLENLYGQAAHLDMKVTTHGASVQIVLPLRTTRLP